MRKRSTVPPYCTTQSLSVKCSYSCGRQTQLCCDSMCQAGSFRMISGLWLTRQLELPDPMFVEKVMPLDTQQRLKFEHRFHPFRQLVQPKPLEYAQYVNDSTIPPTAPPATVFKQAVECFKRCQVTVDKLRAIAKASPGSVADAAGIAAAGALTETCEKWKEVCTRQLHLFSCDRSVLTLPYGAALSVRRCV